MKNNQKKIALVYDWLDTNFGGAEIVLQNLLEIFPDAVLFTAFANFKECQWIGKAKVKTSFLQKYPLIYKNKSLASLFLPIAFESFDLSDFDIIISISSFASKYILTKPNQIHYAYILTPPRFLFSHQNDYKPKLAKIFPFNFIYKKILNYLKKVDLIAVNRADKIIAISKLVQKRIKKNYNKDSIVIYPPVDLQTREILTTQNKKNLITDVEKLLKKVDLKKYYLVVSRLVFYKRVDLAIKAIVALKKNLIIVGSSGGEKKILFELCFELGLEKKVFRYKNKELIVFHNKFSKIVFLKDLEKKEILNLMKVAQGFLLVGVEDFGIAAFEASLMGCVVIANQNSGVYELISDNKKLGFEQTNFENLLKTIKKNQENIREKQLNKIDKNLLIDFEKNWKKLIF